MVMYFTPKRLKLLPHIFVSTCLVPLVVFAAIFCTGNLELAVGTSWLLSGVAALWHLRGSASR